MRIESLHHHWMFLDESLDPRLALPSSYDPALVVLSVVIASLVSVGATFGGSLVYEYGFNVETAGDDPVWHKSETDVFPGKH